MIGGLLMSLDLQAIVEFSRPRGLPCGYAGIKQRVRRALHVATVCVHAIEPVRLVSPEAGPMSVVVLTK